MHFTKYVKVRQEKFGAVIFETLKEKVFVTDKIGADILRLLEEGYGDCPSRTVPHIIKVLESEYGENNIHIKSDVIDFVDELEKNGILE